MGRGHITLLAPGRAGDALHVLSCAAGYNIRWLLRAITRLGLMLIFCAC